MALVKDLFYARKERLEVLFRLLSLLYRPLPPVLPAADAPNPQFAYSGSRWFSRIETFEGEPEGFEVFLV
jgi:hypothetical protein